MWSKSGKKLSNDEFDLKLKIDYPHLKREGDYIDSKTAIKFSCRKCGKLYNKKPKELKRIQCGCLEKEIQYKDIISKKNIELIDNYVNVRTKIKHRCLSCNLEFKTSPKSIINSIIGCPSCSGKLFSLNRYKSILPKNIVFLDTEYKGSYYKYTHKCLDCNNEFKTKPNYILHMKTNCPFCSKSKGERQVINFLNSYGLSYISEYTIDISDRKLRFDFYLEKHSIFIEYDGIQHFQPVDLFGGDEYYSVLKENDELKEKWCIENNHILIRIPYYADVDDYLNYVINE